MDICRGNKVKFAIILRGAISKKNIDFRCEKSLYQDDDYINFNATHVSILKHIVNINTKHSFDFFIHCWNKDLEEGLIKLYNPKKYLFEDNNKYIDEINEKLSYSQVGNTLFSQVSQALSIKKGCEILENYVSDTGNAYDGVIICRPDVLIMKDMVIDEYNLNNVYVNAHGDRGGDFHFIMSFENMLKFKHIFESISPYNRPVAHEFIKRYCIDVFGDKFMNDKFIPGLDEEVIRKLKDFSIRNHNVSSDLLKIYGITANDL